MAHRIHHSASAVRRRCSHRLCRRAAKALPRWQKNPLFDRRARGAPRIAGCGCWNGWGRSTSSRSGSGRVCPRTSGAAPSGASSVRCTALSEAVLRHESPSTKSRTAQDKRRGLRAFIVWTAAPRHAPAERPSRRACSGPIIAAVFAGDHPPRSEHDVRLKGCLNPGGAPTGMHKRVARRGRSARPCPRTDRRNAFQQRKGHGCGERIAPCRVHLVRGHLRFPRDRTALLPVLARTMHVCTTRQGDEQLARGRDEGRCGVHALETNAKSYWSTQDLSAWKPFGIDQSRVSVPWMLRTRSPTLHPSAWARWKVCVAPLSKRTRTW